MMNAKEWMREFYVETEEEKVEHAKKYLNSVYGKTQRFLDTVIPSPLKTIKEEKEMRNNIRLEMLDDLKGLEKKKVDLRLMKTNLLENTNVEISSKDIERDQFYNIKFKANLTLLNNYLDAEIEETKNRILELVKRLYSGD